ncbi:MAG: RNase adapter RapZ [Vicinamibacterales bacterium]
MSARTASRRSKKKPGHSFVVVTGLSGSGKSQAIRALEDLGYFCVDNIPTALIPTLAQLAARGAFEKAAIVVDVREQRFLATFPAVYRRLKVMRGLAPSLIFLDATNDALVRRFSETRRPHPMGRGKSVIEGIREERASTAAIRDMADAIVDTSDMTVHELRQFFMGLSRDRARAPLVVNILSFGFKHGVPVDADLMFDARCLPNPHFVPTLRKRTGRDRAVVTFILKEPGTREFIDRLTEYVRFALPYYVQEGKAYLTVAVGCTGGRHRSVMIAEHLRDALASVQGARVRVKHRDIRRSVK